MAEAHGIEQRVFWCNTNRGSGKGDKSLEQRMHARCFAAVWSFEGHPNGTFNYTSHMRRVRRGDIIVMFADGHGVVGVGRAKESRLELLFETHRGRLRDFNTEGENVEEWRIPVKWLQWNDRKPCVVMKPIRGTFLEITRHRALVKSVLKHFRLLGNGD